MLTNVNTYHHRCASGQECGGHAWSRDGLAFSNFTVGAFGPAIRLANGSFVTNAYAERPQVVQAADGTPIAFFVGLSRGPGYDNAVSFVQPFCADASDPLCGANVAPPPPPPPRVRYEYGQQCLVTNSSFPCAGALSACPLFLGDCSDPLAVWLELAGGVIKSATLPDACVAVDCHYTVAHTTTKAAPCDVASPTSFVGGQLVTPGGMCLNGGQGPAIAPCKPGEWFRTDQIQIEACAAPSTSGWRRVAASPPAAAPPVVAAPPVAAPPAVAAAASPPSLDDFWGGAANFAPVRSFPPGAPSFASINAGTRVVSVNGTFYLFGRADNGTAVGGCTQGTIAVSVRASADEGATWSAASPLATPDLTTVCQYADGGAFFDAAAQRWQYLVQSLAPGGKGGWTLSHFSSATADALGPWIANPRNPVVHGGDLFDRICAGAGKHCTLGTVDEGTPDIVEKQGEEYFVTFHGYDYSSRRAVRGVAATSDFVEWRVDGAGLPGDAIFSAADCAAWNISWAAGGCIGSGESSSLRGPGGHIYQVIEAADVELTCDLTPGQQWWPLGVVRSAEWAPSPGWEQARVSPMMVGPHVGCSLQYNSLWRDDVRGTTWWAVWNVDFAKGCSWWHMYALEWAPTALPMPWPQCGGA